MTSVITKKVHSLAYLDEGSVRVTRRAQNEVKEAVLAFIDTMMTATGQKTYYNTKKEQQEVLTQVHDAVFTVNRGLYAAMLTLPGVLDRSIQTGVARLFETSYNDESFLTPENEGVVISHLCGKLPANRLLNMFGEIIDKKICNNASRRFFLRSVIGQKRLPWWAVKYRRKIRRALIHAWGREKASALRSILAKTPANWTAQERRFVAKFVDRYMPESLTKPKTHLYQFIGHVLKSERTEPYTAPLLRAFYDARADLEKGSDLPREILEGIRGRFHKGIDKGVVYELTKGTMTEKQKVSSKRAAADAGVTLDVDWTKQDMVRTYVYALEEGMDDDIRAALNKKAMEVASVFPLSYEHVAVVVDTSESMFGSDQAKRRPMAIALAMRDVLVSTARKKTTVIATNGDFDAYGITQPEDDTDLATSLLEAFLEEPDAVYLITDGYENVPAGRVEEVMAAVRKMGNKTPVYQVTPVIGSETVGIRKLSKEISPMPVAKPESLMLSVVRAALDQDIEQGISTLLTMTRRKLLFN
jgi:hypothetical protein